MTNEQGTDLEDLRNTRRATLNISEVATLLGVDRRSATRAIEAGEIPHISIGHRRLVPTEWLRATLIDSHRVA